MQILAHSFSYCKSAPEIKKNIACGKAVLHFFSIREIFLCSYCFKICLTRSLFMSRILLRHDRQIPYQKMCFISNASWGWDTWNGRKAKNIYLWKKKKKVAWIGMRKRVKKVYIIVLDHIQKMSKIEFLADYLRQ